MKRKQLVLLLVLFAVMPCSAEEPIEKISAYLPRTAKKSKKKISAYTSDTTKKSKKRALASAPDQAIEAYLDVNQGTPSQFASRALRGFFQATYNAADPYRHSTAPAPEVAFKSSLTTFITSEYNQANYAQRLSRDSSHVVEFLGMCRDLNLNAESAYTGLRLFTNKLKWCEIIDDSVVAQVIQPLPDLLLPYFTKKKQPPRLDLMVEEMENIMLDRFTAHLPQFQAEPDVFITQLSQQLGELARSKVTAANKAAQKDAMVERLRTQTKQLLETMIARMMWNPRNPEGLARSFVTIGNGIVLLGEKGIFDHMDDLDDLISSLTTRFCYFLDLYGSAIPTEVHNQLLADLDDEAIFFLELDELDEGLTPKKTILAQHLISAKTRALALETRGMHSDQYV